MNYTGDRKKGGGSSRKIFRNAGDYNSRPETDTVAGDCGMSTKLLEAPAEIGRVYTSDEKGLFFPKKKNRVIV